ncbi:MAG: response regulator transcription factor [Chloroflexota bacterium]|nr:response regulator transcription factor [Chloroflexota bacterium]
MNNGEGMAGTGTDAERLARVLVVDDEPLIVQMLTIALTYEKFEVSVARDGHEAILKASQMKPDLVILDVMLPGMDGIEVCRRLRSGSDVGILMLTARGDDEDQVVGLESGADDYLPKPFTLPVLLARMKAILRRKGINLQSTLRAGDVALDRLTRKVSRGEQQVELTPREFDLLEMLLSHPRQVFSREAILNRVWGYDYFGDTNVVDVYVRYLREKLGDESRTLIRSLRGVGYALEPSTPGTVNEGE